MQKLYFVLFLTGIILIAGIFTADARPEYAQKEGKQCGYCHLNPGGGGTRGFRGVFYGANKLSFDKFDEKRESTIAGVKPDAMAGETQPAVGYLGAVSGDAATGWRQIQLGANRTQGVIAMFIDSASDDAKSAAKILHKVALAYGPKIVVVAVTKGDADKALKLTSDLGSQLRVLPDPEGSTAKKYGATQGFDMVVVSKMGNDSKLISGFSKGNLETAIAQMGAYGVEAPQGLDLTGAPTTTLHGGKLLERGP